MNGQSSPGSYRELLFHFLSSILSSAAFEKSGRVPTFFVWPAFHFRERSKAVKLRRLPEWQANVQECGPAIPKTPQRWRIPYSIETAIADRDTAMKEAELKQRQSLETAVTKMAEQVAASMGMEVVLVEIKGSGNRSIVRTFIDQPEGISLDDCERFSRRFSVSLDVEDLIPSSYTLEVSSPGINRPLVKESDFLRFRGENATVRTRTPIDGRKNFKGRIAGVTEGRLGLEMTPGNTVSIALMDIEKANLVGDSSIRPQGS
jgi:ribosome maturation factor RimP